jgi:predicted nucleic acid-binding protein
MTDGALVVDANILLGSALGRRVPEILARYSRHVNLVTPSICLEEAHRNIPAIAARRNVPVADLILELDRALEIIRSVEPDRYEAHERNARERMGRHPNDWPIVATALLLKCPIWTQDSDFFGCGIATWTTATVEIYLREATLMA